MCVAPMYGRWVQEERKYRISRERWPGYWIYDPRDIMIPCGGCVECRLAKASQWANRMMLELDHSKTAIFATLTYDPDHIHVSMFDDNDEPIYTLDKRDCQLFLKRLRRRFEPREIRFYLAGEYGDKTARPHYHAIIFGLSLQDFPDLISYSKNEYGQMVYISPYFASIWRHGNCLLANVSWQTCAYVARYTMKKLTGELAEFYALRQQLPPFALMSRDPGIGGYYVKEHPDAPAKSYLYVRDDFGVSPRTKIRPPKYIFDKLRLTNPKLYDIIKSQRRLSAQLSIDSQLADTDLGFLEYMDINNDEALRHDRMLPRNKV